MRFRLPLLLALPLAACGSPQPPPGYDGPIPSVEARGALDGLRGATFTVRDGPLAGPRWTYAGFAVIPNPRTGKGPVARLSSGDRVELVPLLTDADAEDLAARVRGEHGGEPSEGVSEAYAAVWR